MESDLSGDPAVMLGHAQLLSMSKHHGGVTWDIGKRHDIFVFILQIQSQIDESKQFKSCLLNVQ